MRKRNYSTWREDVTLFVFLLIFFLFFKTLYALQVKQGDYYRAQMEGLYNVLSFNQKERGKIYLKNNELLAADKDIFSLVFLKNSNEEEIKKEVSLVARIIMEDEQELLKKIFEKEHLIIKEELSEKEFSELKREKLNNFYLISQKKRVYPKNTFASHLIGFVNKDHKGQYGIEEFYDEYLSQGMDIVLTLEPEVQEFSERLIEKFQETLKFEKGEILILDPQTGQIIAFVNFPNFDPNLFFKVPEKDYSLFINFSTQELFEPGSVLKPFTVATALEEGLISPNETYEDKGQVRIGGWVIYNYDNRVFGRQTMTNVLEKSINTGAVYIEQKIPKDKFLDYFSRFGFFEKTGIDLPEIFSQNQSLRKGYEINLATASFGQGIEMTSLQLLKAYTVFTNEGNIIRPYVVKEIWHDGQKEEKKLTIERRVLSLKTVKTAREMLYSVIENGYSKKAKINGYSIAGKTGTAQVSFSSLGIKKQGYSDKTIQSFMGFFPVSQPRFLILVKLHNPQTKTAEYSSLLIFKQLVEYLIHYYQIPPDNI